MPKCLVCGKHVKLINGLHLRTHRMTAQQYREQFPNAVMSDASFREKRARVMKERWADPEIRAQVTEACRQIQLRAWEGNDERRAAQAERAPEMVAKIWSDPEKRARMSDRRRNTAFDLWQQQDYRYGHDAARSAGAAKRWADPTYRVKITATTKWTKPERTVRAWLQHMRIYQIEPGFYPHIWLPITEGFKVNGDFVDPFRCLVIHVDGEYWHKMPENAARDARADQWCRDNGWLFIRLTDADIDKRPEWCKDQIQLLVSARQAPLLD